MAGGTPRSIVSLDNALKARNVTKVFSSAGNPGRALRVAADTAATPYLDRAAKRFAFKNRGKLGRFRAKKDGKKLHGVSFWLIVGLAIIKDLLDIVLNISLILILLVIPIGFIISFGVFIYLYLQGVKMDSRKLATLIIGFFIDLLPLLSILPTFTITLFIIRFLENSKGKGVIGSLVRKVKAA